MLLYKCYFNAIIMHVHNHILNDVTFDKKLVVSICGLSCISLIDVCFVLYVQNYKLLIYNKLEFLTTILGSSKKLYSLHDSNYLSACMELYTCTHVRSLQASTEDCCCLYWN